MKTRCSWYAAAPSYVTLVVGDQEMLRAEGPPYEAARGAAGPFWTYLKIILLILIILLDLHFLVLRTLRRRHWAGGELCGGRGSQARPLHLLAAGRLRGGGAGGEGGGGGGADQELTLSYPGQESPGRAPYLPVSQDINYNWSGII